MSWQGWGGGQRVLRMERPDLVWLGLFALFSASNSFRELVSFSVSIPVSLKAIYLLVLEMRAGLSFVGLVWGGYYLLLLQAKLHETMYLKGFFCSFLAAREHIAQDPRQQHWEDCICNYFPSHLMGFGLAFTKVAASTSPTHLFVSTRSLLRSFERCWLLRACIEATTS